MVPGGHCSRIYDHRRLQTLQRTIHYPSAFIFAAHRIHFVSSTWSDYPGAIERDDFLLQKLVRDFGNCDCVAKVDYRSPMGHRVSGDGKVYTSDSEWESEMSLSLPTSHKTLGRHT